MVRSGRMPAQVLISWIATCRDAARCSRQGADMVRGRRQDLDVEHLMRILENDQAYRDLRLYYGVGLGAGELPPFTGGRFEFVDGGGDRSDVCNRFTSSDIFSLELLSVQLPSRVGLDLLEGALGEDAAVFLGEIPTSVPLWDEGAVNLIEDGGPADGAGPSRSQRRDDTGPPLDHVVGLKVARSWAKRTATADAVGRCLGLAGERGP